MEDTMDLGLAIEILEITDIDDIKESDLKKIQRRANKRWHTDTIAHTNPTAETLKRYEHNFGLIKHAIELIKAYLSGDFYTYEHSTYQHEHTDYEEPEDILRRNAPAMQETLKEAWAEVKRQGFKLRKEKVTWSPGISIKDSLAQDLKDNIPIFSIASSFFGMFLYMLLMLIATITLSNSPILYKSVVIIISGAWFIQSLACFIGLLPLSRFWLPQKIADIVIYLINVGIKFYNIIEQFGLTRFTPIAIIFNLPYILAKIVQLIIVTPVYLIAGMILGDRMVGKVEKKVNLYADLEDWYIEDLIHGDPIKFSSDELFALSHAYTELREVV